MYEQHFGLNKRPFDAKPAGTDVFVGPQTARTMAGFRKALAANDAVVTVSGPVGTGKTTLVERSVDAMGIKYKTIRVGRMEMDSSDVLEALLIVLGVQDRPAGTIQRFAVLRKTLKELEDRDVRVFILVEDGLRTGPETLAELEALTAADAGESSGACIVVMGDERLPEFMQDPRLAQLQQRVRQRHTILPFEVAELRGYLTHCCRLAGGEFDVIFESRCAELLHELSGGIARVANNLVESVLNAAAAKSISKIPATFIAEIASDEYGLSAENFEFSVSAAETPVENEVVEPQPIADAELASDNEPPQDSDDVPHLIHDTLPDLKILSPQYATQETDDKDDNSERVAETKPAVNEDTADEFEPVPEIAPPATPVADLVAELEPLQEPEPRPKPVAELVAEIEPLQEPEPRPKPVAELVAEIEPLPEPAAQAKPVGEIVTELEPLPDSAPELEPAAELIPELESLPDAAPEQGPAAEIIPELEPLPHAAPQQEPAAELIPELEPLQKPAAQQQPVAESIPDLEPLQTPGPQQEPVADVIPELEPLPGPELVAESEKHPEPERATATELIIETVAQLELETLDQSATVAEVVSGPEFAPDVAATTGLHDKGAESDREPTLAELTPDLDALEQAMAFTQGKPVDETVAIEEPLERLSDDIGGSSVIPEITLDKQIDPPPESKKPQPEIDKIAADLANAKSLEDIDDKAAETLFGTEISMIAAQIVQNPPVDESANDELQLEAEEQVQVSVAAEQTSQVAAVGVVSEEVSLETPTPVSKNSGIDLTASQRLKTVRALGADSRPPIDSEKSPAASHINAAKAGEAPDSIEDQINTSITQTLKALKIPNDVEDDEPEEKKKKGFFSRFRRS